MMPFDNMQCEDLPPVPDDDEFDDLGDDFEVLDTLDDDEEDEFGKENESEDELDEN